jgi:CelD/BcsL family acetyltransferase involved in cellulose biosynthesis
VKTDSTIKTSVLIDESSFEALGTEWNELLEQSDQHIFFLRFAWNRLWWRFLRPPDSELFIVTCRDEEGRLVGLAPFYVRQRKTAGIPHVRELLFLGTGIYAQTSEYLDVIARRGYERAVADATAGCLANEGNWDRLCLREIPESSTMLPHLVRALEEDAQIEACNRSYYIDTTVDWESFTRGLSTSARKNVLYRTRKLFSKHECRMKRVDAFDEIDPAMDALIRLHQARWKSKGEPGAFALINFEEFVRETARASFAEAKLRILTLEMDGAVAAARLAFQDNHITHAFQAGFDPAYLPEGVGSIMNGLTIKASFEDAYVREYDFMGGSEPHKERWAKKYKDSVSLTAIRPGTRSTAYRNLELAKAMGKSLVRATVPRSVRLAGHRLITQRHYK